MPETRLALLNAAANLFAEKGLENTKVREIVARAGQANVSALHYHFGSKQGLVRVLFSEWTKDVDLERGERMAVAEAEALKTGKALCLPDLCALLANPFLDHVESSPRAAQGMSLICQALQAPEYAIDPMDVVYKLESTARLLELIRASLPDLSDEVVKLRLRATLSIIINFGQLLASKHDQANDEVAAEIRAQIVPILLGVLTAPATQAKSDHVEQIQHREAV